MATVTNSSQVLEGFFCPVCLQDLKSVAQLQVHFEEKHASEDSAVFNSIKSIFSKAKEFLKTDEEESSPDVHLPSGTASKVFSKPLATPEAITKEGAENNPWNWTNEFKATKKSHTSLFKKIRSDRIDAYVAETNKLLLRLDKLLTDMPSDPVKRKAHEKDLVPWARDDCVPLCPDCGKGFSALTRRRHHCRLCGGIMCHNCSLFLSMAFAKKLVTPIHVASSMSGDSSTNFNSPGHSSTVSLGNRNNGLSLPSFGLRRSGSHSSLNSMVSVMDSLTGEQHFRTCKHCYQRVSARDHAIELRQSKPLLTLLYSKLMTDRNTLLRLLPQYQTMAESLWSGESVYSLKDANDLRIKLLRLSDSVNATAQKIRSLGPVEIGYPEGGPADESMAPPSPRQELLQKRIHQATTTFLKTNVLGLDKLPEDMELSQLQHKRREEASARLAAEREAADLAEQRAEMALQKIRLREDKPRSASPITRAVQAAVPSSGGSTPQHQRMGGEIVVEEGWGGDRDAHVVTATDDPLIQQMNIIRNYIRQAREASRYDEVATLEKNLKELQDEYRRQHSKKL